MLQEQNSTELLAEKAREVVATAGSKVLITGAYLIIDPANEGIVLSTDAKFYTTVKEISMPDT